MASTVLLRGKKTSMKVHAWGFSKKMLLQPGVVTTDLEMGIVAWLFEKDKPDESVTGRLWGLVMPHNLIACWRGMLILQEVGSFNEGDLCNAYYAGQRNTHDSNKHRIDEITAKIGKSTYDAIMARPIPNDVVELIIKIADEGEPIALWPITEEVEAGTLKWRKKFAQIGVKHPKEVADREAAEKQVIKRYDSHLIHYAKRHKHPRECMIMWNIETAIAGAVEKGVEDQHGEDVVLGIAIVRAHGGTAAFAAMVVDHDDEGRSIKRAVKEAVSTATKWLVSRFRTGGFVKIPKRPRREYKNIIEQLDADWENMPTIHPLIAA